VDGDWVNEVNWVQADVMDENSWKFTLSGKQEAPASPPPCQGCLLGSFFVVPAGALPVPVSDRYICLYRASIANFPPAKAGFTAGQSIFTAVPGRQHNCFPSALRVRVQQQRPSHTYAASPHGIHMLLRERGCTHNGAGHEPNRVRGGARGSTDYRAEESNH
jgi:hypothetical protein